MATTRQSLQQRSDIDLEVVVGKPHVKRAETMKLCDYAYGLYASQSYLEEHGAPTDLESLCKHRIIYFADSIVQVNALDMLPSFDLSRIPTISASNTSVHVEATRAGAGIGLLARYMTRRHSELARVMQDTIAISLSYWLGSKSDILRRPEVAEVIRELQAVVREKEGAFGKRLHLLEDDAHYWHVHVVRGESAMSA
ncbi:LysR substrate-binding domain-containing protein [Humidisolicoccus flavus]|uniref:LysR substrate-binding domain-containing protein n=1 Tax=Humidisolicoccus flavus TaxID=3111414 RepID=UPI003253D801